MGVGGCGVRDCCSGRRPLKYGLLLNKQVVVARSAFYQLRLVYQLRPYLDLASVTHASVTSILDYCNELKVGLPLETTTEIAVCAKCSGINAVGGARKYDPISPILQELH